MEVDKTQIVESEGIIHRTDENGLDKMELSDVSPEALVDALPIAHSNHSAVDESHIADDSQEGVHTKEVGLQASDPTGLASPPTQLLVQNLHHRLPTNSKSPPKHALPKLETAPSLQNLSTSTQPQLVSHHTQQTPASQHHAQQPQPSATQTQVPTTPQQQSPQQQQQQAQTPDGKNVKRGRGGRRVGAGRKRKVDSIAKADGSPTSPAQTTKSNTSQSSPSATRHPLHGTLQTETSTPTSKPAKKKKLYDELSDGVKNSSRQLKFGYTILYVKEVEKTVEFYERAFGLKRRFVHESKQYAEMDTGVTALSFASNELAKSNLTPVEFRPNEPTQLPPGMEIAFSSFDVQRDYKRAVEAGAKSVSAPKVLPWGQIVAYVRDLNGVLVEIASTSAAANK